MRRKDKQITDKLIIENILTKSKICRVALNDSEFPYIFPMNYGYSNSTLYFHCAKEGRKIDLIKKNNKAGFEIESGVEIIPAEKACNWSTKYRSIIGHGEIEILTDFDDKKIGMDIIMKHYGGPQNNYNPKVIESMLIFKLNIIESSGKQSGHFNE